MQTAISKHKMKFSALTRIVFAVIALAVVFTLLMGLMLQEFEQSNQLSWKKITRRSWRSEDHERSIPKFHIRQHGKYWILYNYIPAKSSYGYNDTITLTTHGDYNYLDLLSPLLQRWRSPISLVIFASGSDFGLALNSIRYLRDCASPTGLMMDLLVSYSFVLHEDHLPSYIPKTPEEIFEVRFNCIDPAPFNGDHPSYRHIHALEYPINLLRNVGREAAHTYYVFPLHIELFPTPNFVGDFMHMVKKIKVPKPRKTVYCLPVFEVRHGLYMPKTKSELKSTLRANTLMPFHAFDATKNEVPNQSVWLAAADPGSLQIFQITKRIGKWEPWCVTINKEEPLHDERFSWSTVYDKLIQSELLQDLDYDFAVLDGAFLVQYARSKLFQQYNYDNSKIATALPIIVRKKYQQQLLKFYDDTKLITQNATIPMN